MATPEDTGRAGALAPATEHTSLDRSTLHPAGLDRAAAPRRSGRKGPAKVPYSVRDYGSITEHSGTPEQLTDAGFPPEWFAGPRQRQEHQRDGRRVSVVPYGTYRWNVRLHRTSEETRAWHAADKRRLEARAAADKARRRVHDAERSIAAMPKSADAFRAQMLRMAELLDILELDLSGHSSHGYSFDADTLASFAVHAAAIRQAMEDGTVLFDATKRAATVERLRREAMPTDAGCAAFLRSIGAQPGDASV